MWKHLAPPPGAGTGLERYAGVLNAVEINSSFYRPHERKVYERWAAAVPDHFRFAVKIPKTITHEQKFRRSREALREFLEQSGGLGAKRGVFLVQLPGKFEFDARLSARFFALFREMYDGDIVCEPRNASWFTPAADALLRKHRIARVAADPPRGSGAVMPGGWDGIVYYRLHGSPRCYFSPYDQPFLAALAARLQEHTVPVWCIFDNTGSGAAFENALRIRNLVSSRGAVERRGL
jgi:uncharacterized protein YecE (DUF72 family)